MQKTIDEIFLELIDNNSEIANNFKRMRDNQKYNDPYIGNFRCDDFINMGNKKNILFLGDSFAAGDGLLKEDTWCYKVFEKINKNEDTAGYFNIGVSGITIIESIWFFFNFCKYYTTPDILFLLQLIGIEI